MKKLVIVALAAFAFVACNQTKADKVVDQAEQATPTELVEDAPKVKFEKEIYDFGVIEQGEKVTYDFKFTNTGKTPLIITDATATCGCTVPEIPKAPIKPGESGTIKVVFDSTGKLGMQDKQITLISNANPTPDNLHLVGEIKEKK